MQGKGSFGSSSCLTGILLILLSQIQHRVFTLDVVLAVLELPEREADNTVPLEHQKYLKHKFLVQEIMFDRCSDKTPTVRSKALSSFAHCLEQSVVSMSQSLQELMISSKCGGCCEMKLGQCLARKYLQRNDSLLE